MRIITREQWGAAPADVDRIENRNLSAVTVGVVHYSDSAAVDDVRPADEPGEHEQVQLVRAIQRFHMEGKQWADIAYHWLFAPDGTIFAGRPVGQVGAHSAGHNTESVGYCVLTDGPITDEAKTALLERIHADRAPLGAPYATIGGHRAFNPTACPGDTIAGWVDSGLEPPTVTLPGPAAPPTTCAELPPGPPPGGRPLLKVGAKGAAVRELQQLLADHGYPPDDSVTKKGGWDGVFGPKTRAAVVDLQTDRNLVVDGVAGRQVYCALGIT